MSDTQEKAVIAEVLDGNAESYRILVERYHRGLIQHLYNLVYDGDMAEDLAQEAFIRAYEKLSRYNEAYAFSTWLYRIADNIAYRHFKHVRLSQDIDEIQEYLPDSAPAPEEVVDHKLSSLKVREAVAKLPAEYRQVVTLYYWEDYSYEEIATIMDRPIGTIRTWLYRAKEHLRKELYGQV